MPNRDFLRKRSHISGESSLHDYVDIILSKKWLIAAVFFVAVAVSIILSVTQIPIYRATTLIKIERKNAQILSFKEGMPFDTGDELSYREYYETQYKLIKSKSVLGNVFRLAGLKDNDEFKDKDDPLEHFLTMITVTPIRLSQLVEVSADSPDPKLAAKLANLVVDEFLKQNFERNLAATTEASKWLSTKIIEQKKKIISSEKALEAYKNKKSGKPMPEQVTGDEAGEDQSIEFFTLQKQYETNKQIQDMLVERLSEVNLAASPVGSSVVIIDKAEAPKKPIRPNLLLNVMIGIFSGLWMGVSFAMLVNYMDLTIKTPDDIRQILGRVFIDTMPKIQKKNWKERDTIVNAVPNSPESESYRSIRTQIDNRVSVLNKDVKVILIASIDPNAGKTTTASNLSIAFALQGKKTVLVDCDLRKPQIHAVFDEKKEKGVADYLSGSAGAKDIIKKAKIANLDIVTSGEVVYHPGETIGSKRLPQLFEELKRIYDIVIIDAPPFINLADSFILSEITDGMVLVMRSGKTFIPQVIRIKDFLEDKREKIISVVLNDVINRRHKYDYYYSYYGEKRNSGQRPHEHKKSGNANC